MTSKMISAPNIAKALGYGNSPAFILSSAILALILLFYIYTVGSYFHIGVSPLENRVNYHESFSIYITNEYFDHLIIAAGTVLWIALSLIGKVRIVASTIYGIITIAAISAKIGTILDTVALISIPVVISFLIYNRLMTKKILHSSNLTITYLTIIGFAIGIISSVISLAPLFSITQKSIPISDYAYEIFVLLIPLSSFLAFFLIMSAPFKLAMKNLIVLHVKNTIQPITDDVIRSKTKILYLSLFMFLSITIALIPHQFVFNPDNQEVGSDSGDYVATISNFMESNNSQEIIKKAFVIPFSNDRPLASLFLYSIVKIVPATPSYTADHIPIILAPSLVLVIFFLTRELTSNDTTSLLASFLTAVSFHELIGIYSGIYANLLALVIGFLSFVFLIRFLKVSNRLNLVTYSVLLLLLVFTHVYTWTIFALFTGIFLAVMYKLDHYRKKSIIMLLIVVLSSVVIDVTRSSLTGTSGGIEHDIGLGRAAGVDQFTLLWSNLIDTTQNYSGGLFSNFIILTLGAYWLVRSNSRELSSIFILVFLALAVLPLLVGNGVIQSRMLYNIPFQIPAAIGLTYLKRQTSGTLVILSICIWILAMSIKNVSNFYFISPS